MQKYVCIHGHFYQPPRENAWLEAVELQDSAAPDHDWNERVTAECYAPNGAARRLDSEGRIESIVSNYSRISFNFGPTLLAWMKENAPEIHQTIIEADRLSQRRFGGHGSALAQCYNHMILPLAHPRDRFTQVHWGIRDFEHRFGRKPEGMWLAETAADDPSLESLAEQGIKFTILSPYQASRVRALAGGDWWDVDGAQVDPSMPYVVNLKSGRKIAVFFYDAPVSQAVAFERLLADGRTFANRLMDGFDDSRGSDQLVHIATDGESYGHHHPYGEMALAAALHRIETKKLARLTNYGEYLETHPPTHEVQIHQKSAWSCSHGVERWNSNCGCNSGGRPGWNQNWRLPLRQAFDWLRDELAPHYESKAKVYLKDPWAARNDYISVILDRSSENITAFFERHAVRTLTDDEVVLCLRLLEIQRHAMLMYTSCGWFFDDISGIETVQVIQYAARAMQLAADIFGHDFEAGFLKILEKARSNIREHRDGRVIYNKFVRPAIVDREKVAAHYAVSSLFESYPDAARIFSFTVIQEDRHFLTAGNTRMAIGRIKVTFEITRNSDVVTYGVLHLGEHTMNCGVRFFQGQEPYDVLLREMTEAFDRSDFPQIIRLMDQHFGESSYSLKSLFRDEQRRVLQQILAATREDLHNTYRLVTDRYVPLMRFLADIRAPAPEALRLAARFVLNSELIRQFEADQVDLERTRSLLAECVQDEVSVEPKLLGYAIKAHLERLSEEFLLAKDDLTVLSRYVEVAELVRELPFDINLWKPQNAYFGMLNSTYPAVCKSVTKGIPEAVAWAEQFRALGEHLGFKVDHQRAPSPPRPPAK